MIPRFPWLTEEQDVFSITLMLLLIYQLTIFLSNNAEGNF